MSDFKILDTATGITHDLPESFRGHAPFYWQEGNGSCDCNRAMACGVADFDSAKCGNARFYIVDAAGKPLADFNEGYPPLEGTPA